MECIRVLILSMLKFLLYFISGYIVLFFGVTMINYLVKNIHIKIETKKQEDKKVDMWATKKIKPINKTWNKSLGVWEIDD